MTKNISYTVVNFSYTSDDTHIRPKDCAELLGISIATFWRLVQAKQIKTIKITERTTSVTAKELRTFMASKLEGQHHGTES